MTITEDSNGVSGVRRTRQGSGRVTPHWAVDPWRRLGLQCPDGRFRQFWKLYAARPAYQTTFMRILPVL